ncbi:unnamed protein product [Calypogeia fissa]
MHSDEEIEGRQQTTGTMEDKENPVPKVKSDHRVHEGKATMTPVRGDVRLVDGKETLVFSGSQKAISWLNKIFSSMHESSLPTRLQKHSRRSSSAPSRSLISDSPREFKTEGPPSDLVLRDESPPTKTRRPKSREKSPRHSPRLVHGAGMRRAKAWGSPPASPNIRDHPTSLSRQKKSFLRGKRPATSSPRDSTSSSRAKSCERVRPKSSGILSPSSPQKRRMVSSLIKPTTLPTAAPNATNGVDHNFPQTTPQRLSITPHRVRSQTERPYTAAANKHRESPSTTGAARESTKAPTRGMRRPTLSSTVDDEDFESPSPIPTPRQQTVRNERPVNPERVKTLSISPFSPLARMTISSANRRKAPVASTALMRRFGSPSKLTSIPEMLLQRPGSPIHPSSPQNVEHKRPWDYTESPTSSTPRESSTETSNVNSPITPRDGSTAPTTATNTAVEVTPRALKSPLASANGRPMTPIASDFLRAAPDEESWRRLLSNPHKTFFKNPLFNKALERKPSTALRSLAHPGEMIMESTLKQFSSATRKFISRALTRISKVDSHHKSHLATVICQ